MIYFFTKGQEFVRCEIMPGSPHALRVIEPDGAEHAEHFFSTEQLDDRWSAIRGELQRAGWSGPFGRDGRT